MGCGRVAETLQLLQATESFPVFITATLEERSDLPLRRGRWLQAMCGMVHSQDCCPQPVLLTTRIGVVVVAIMWLVCDYYNSLIFHFRDI